MLKSTLLFTLVLGLAASFLGGALHAATLIVANKAEATVSLVDLASGKVVATLPVGNAPHEVAVSRDGRLALIANYGTGPQPGSTLTLIDVPGAKVVKTVDLGEYKRPHGLTFGGDHRAFVTAEASKALLEVDLEAGKVLRAITTGQEVSHMVAVTPDGSRAFVANIGSGTITALDLSGEGKKLADIQTGAGAEGIAVTPDGKQVWVTNRAADTVSVVDTATLKVLKTIEAASFPIRAEVTPDGKWALVSLAKSGDLAIFSTTSLALERRVPLEATVAADRGGRLLDFGNSSVPIGIEIAPDGQRAYVAHANADQISIVDLKEGKRIGFLTAGKEPDGMGMSALDVKAAN